MEEPLDMPAEDGFLLVEGWMLGVAIFAEAMAEVDRGAASQRQRAAPGADARI